ncbi:MAG: hypothetical protein ACFCUL_14975 [Flavobacteriaceae bacterium]
MYSLKKEKEGLTVSIDKATVNVSGSGFKVQFDSGKGELISFDYRNGNMLLSGMEANF